MRRSFMDTRREIPKQQRAVHLTRRTEADGLRRPCLGNADADRKPQSGASDNPGARPPWNRGAWPSRAYKKSAGCGTRPGTWRLKREF